MKQRCTATTKILHGDTDQVLAVDYGSHAVYAFGADGVAKRVRHRRGLPVDAFGTGPVVWAVPKGVDVSDELMARATELAQLGATRRLERLIDGSVSGRSIQARRSEQVPGGFLSTTSQQTLLGEGGVGFVRDAKSELAALLTSDRVSATVYESAQARRARATALVNSLSAEDPMWLVDFARTLRNEHKVRTAALTLAVDAIEAGHPDGRALLDAVLVRPDEPGLALRYYLDTYGHQLPAALKKGVADAAQRLYTERAAIDWDKAHNRSVHGENTSSTPVMFADVLALVHPAPTSDAQAALFAYLVKGGEPDPEKLGRLAKVRRLRSMDTEAKREALEQSAAEAHEILAGGYGARRRMDGDVGALGVRELLAWRPSTAEAEKLSADVRSAAAAVREAAAEERERCGLLADAGYFTMERRLAKLVRHQRNDGWGWTYTHGDVDMADDQSWQRETRAETITVLKEELSALESYYGDPAQLKATTRAAKRRLEKLQDERKKANAVPAAVWEVACVEMSYRDSLSNLINVANAGVSDEALMFLSERIGDVAALRESNTQLTDLMTAAQVVQLREKRPTWGFSAAERRPAQSISGEARVTLQGALDTAGSVLAADTLGDLGTKRVLVLADGSGSMWAPVSTRRGDQRADSYDGLRRDEVACMFAGMIAQAGQNVDVVVYDTEAHPVDVTGAAGPITAAQTIANASPGGATDTWGVLMDTYDDHDVVVILTDEQTSWSPFEPGTDGYRYSYYDGRGRRERRMNQLPTATKVITCNLAGDVGAQAPSHPNHLSIAGVSPVVLEGVGAAVAGEPWSAGI